MNIDIPDLLRALEVDERVDDTGGRVVQGECETIFRLSQRKLQPPTLGKGEFLRSYIAVDLALGKLGISFPKEALLKKANNVKQKVYNDNYTRIKNSLGSRVAPMGGNIANLAVKFSGTSADRSSALLRTFQDACRCTVTAEHANRLVEKYSTPEYHAAAFCVASVQDKHMLDRKAVAEMVKLQPKDLDKICVDMVTKCGLSSLQHVAKAFRLEAPGSAGKGQRSGAREAREAGGAKSKGKRPLSPRQRESGRGSGGGGGSEGGSPATATTTRLDGLDGGDQSPSSPYRSDQRAAGAGGKGGGAEKQLHFFEAVGGRTSGPRAQQQQQQPADPAASLNLFLKRLRTLRSKSYEGWCLKTLGMEGAAVAS